MQKAIIVCLVVFIPATGFAQDNLSFQSLDSCIRFALANSPGLLAEEEAVKAAGADTRLSKSQLLPKAAAGADFSITNRYAVLDKYTAGSAGLEISQPVWFNGKLKTLVDQSEMSRLISETQYQLYQQELAFRVGQNYFDLLRQQQLEMIAGEMADRIAITVESAKARFKVGTSRRSDILKAETEWSNAVFRVNQYQTGKIIAEKSLLQTIGADPASGIFIKNMLTNVDTLYSDQETEYYYQTAEKYLPELKFARYLIDLQKLNLEFEKKAYGPELSAYAGYRYSDIPVQNDLWSGEMGVSFSISVFNGFERKNKCIKETILIEQRKNELQEIILEVRATIQQAYQVLLQAKQQINNSLDQRKNASENLKIVKEEYLQGISSMLELMDAENADFIANQNYIEALYGFQIARIALERKSGMILY